MDPDSDKIHWPIRSIVPDNSIEALTNTVFPGISDQNGPLPTTAYLADRVLLAARNDTVMGINHSILNTSSRLKLVPLLFCSEISILPMVCAIEPECAF